MTVVGKLKVKDQYGGSSLLKLKGESETLLKFTSKNTSEDLTLSVPPSNELRLIIEGDGDQVKEALDNILRVHFFPKVDQYVNHGILKKGDEYVVDTVQIKIDSAVITIPLNLSANVTIGSNVITYTRVQKRVINL